MTLITQPNKAVYLFGLSNILLVKKIIKSKMLLKMEK